MYGHYNNIIYKNVLKYVKNIGAIKIWRKKRGGSLVTILSENFIKNFKRPYDKKLFIHIIIIFI